jgi:hypothetical protein
VPNTDVRPTSPYVFSLGPFRFESDIDIPELRSSTGSGDLPVTIRLGNVPRTLDHAVPYGPECQISPTEYLLDIPETARYYVAHGREVRLEITPGAPPANVSTYLLGSVFGVLCHQNGLLPLHASAVEHNGRVTAFLGDSGAGKSTLAASLHRRGHRIVSDDICLLAPHGDQMRVVPVAVWLKLWNQSLQHLGETPIEQNRVYSTDDKFRVFLPTDSKPDAATIANIVFLTRDPAPAATLTLNPMPPLEAIAGLMRLTYVPYFPPLAGQQPRLFQQCARMFQNARAWRLTVPWNLARLDAVLTLIERDLLTP